MTKFNAAEIFQMAIKLEKNGEKFYRNAAKQTSKENLKKIFTDLADQEVDHRKVFEDMSKTIIDLKPIELYPDEYFTYLHSYMNNIIFNQERQEKIMHNIHASIPAIDFALQGELESIYYYSEIRMFVPENQRPLIDKIIKEERAHFKRLSELKKDLCK